MANDRVRRWLTPGIPFALSLALSLSTAGDRVYWQDSGLYLAAVNDLGVLYPPGFVLYLLLCKGWTLVFGFLDFTRAVHLFSSLCAALAGATSAVSARELLRSRSRLFQVTDTDPGPHADIVGAVVGCLAVSGYTGWFAGIYAKGYSLYYLVLSLLIWRMIRAAETGRPKDFTLVAVLIGLAWATHPSSATLAFVLAAFVLSYRKLLGWKGIGLRFALAAGCALGPSLVLPLLAARHPPFMMGDPTHIGELGRYLTGSRFTTLPGAFGFDAVRFSSFGQYLWEEMLGIGLLLLTAGIARLARTNPRLLSGILLWLVPYAAVTLLFKLEGQHDCWLVAAWMPAYLAIAVGLHSVALRAGRFFAPAAAALGLAAVAWAVGVNRPLLDQRSYDLAERFGETHLKNVDPNAIVVLRADDAIGTSLYLQRFRGYRPDVLVVMGPFLAEPWYGAKLVRENPGLSLPDFSSVSRFPPARESSALETAAFVNANAGRGRPIFTQVMPPHEAIRPDTTMVPAGVLWKAVPRGEEKIERRYWDFPVEPEDLRGKFRRARGQRVKHGTADLTIRPESYEERFMRLLLEGRKRLALGFVRTGNYEGMLKVLESIERLDPEATHDAGLLYLKGYAAFLLRQEERAESAFRRLLQVPAEPAWVASAHFYLGEILSGRGQAQEARLHYEAAATNPALDPELRPKVEHRLSSRP